MIKCQICKREFKVMITNTHLKLHNVTVSEYRKRYPNSSLVTEEYREKRRERMKGRNNPGYGKHLTGRDNLYGYMFKKGNVPWNKDKSFLVGKDNPMYGINHTEKTKQRMRESALSRSKETSERVKKEWKSIEARRKKIKGVLESWQNPEVRQNHLDALHDEGYLKVRSEISRELWKNDEFREKTVEATLKAIRDNKPYIWKDVYFDSRQEMECARILLDEPIEGFNCHIRINGIEIDFLTESGFIEYHPHDFDGRSDEQYLRERIDRISNSEFSEIPVFLLTSLSEVEEFKRCLI